MASNKKIISITAFATAILSVALLIFESKRSPKINLYDPGLNGNQNEQDPTIGENVMIPTAAGSFNNPGNIRKSSTAYQGEIDLPDSNFTSFVSMAYGYRAMIQILRHYYNQGNNTLRKLISIYAPSSDNNNDEAYVNFITSHMNIDPDADIYFLLYSPESTKIVGAMAMNEQGNGFQPQQYDLTQAYSLLS